MVLKTLGYLFMAVVIALLVQTMVTTYYLGKIDFGLKSSLESTSNLIEIQQAIIQKNNALEDVVTATQSMDRQLTDTLQATKTVHDHINRINELNKSTLELNQGMAQLGDQSGQDLKAISGGMGQLKTSTAELNDSLAKLSEWIKKDSANMQQMHTYTDQMNQKVPGVLR